MIIGISGGSASGKTSFTKKVLKEVNPSYIVHMEHDLYYRNKKDIPEELLSIRNFDHPNSLDTELFIKHIKRLQKNKQIEQPIYDFTTDSRKKETKLITPKPIILIEGLLILSIKSLRNLMDIKVFIHTDTDLRLLRRISRDMKERGRSIDSVVDQYTTTVRPMHSQFVEPNKKYADLIIIREHPKFCRFRSHCY